MTQRKVKTSYPHPDTAAPSGDRPVALVTGASSGIGKALCLVLGRHGYEVAMIARGQAALENAAEEVEAAGGVPMVVPADVTNRNAHEAALDTILARTGRVDVAVAAAGLGYATPAESLDLERLQRMIDVNVTGFVN
ncbi:SDR family NAD(P)-dependent oxidoreductase, partial [bacterium]|nr:SDR family NAD(P)-dependent oxidoreductase [bacterium]